MDDALQQLDQIVSNTLSSFEPKDAIFIVVGSLLLIFGRRLYWLALAGLGFAVALYLSREYLFFESVQQEVIVGVAAGLLGGILAVVAQQLAVRFAGIVLGAWGSFVIARILWPEADLLLAILLAVAGAGLGFLFAAKLFDLALVLVTSIVGAILISQHLYLDAAVQAVVWLVLTLCGVAFQLRRKSKKLRMRPRDD
ncbi:MAG: hypothetical protein MPN21_09585 [Thermoanaerobaculia bacterium]|nr:hypothetical protein [Thermoanaerobaculia bacterium]